MTDAAQLLAKRSLGDASKALAKRGYVDSSHDPDRMHNAYTAVNAQRIFAPSRMRAMTVRDEKIGARLKLVRERKYATAADAARAMGVKVPTYSGHENGSRGTSRAAPRYAAFYRVSLDWLLNGKGDPKPGGVPVVGIVGAGAEVFPFDDYPVGGGLEHVDAPPGADEGTVALRIQGDSQYPLQEGWLIFYREGNQGVQQECLGKLCVVKVADGATLLKTLRHGAKKGRFRLESWNAPPREDVKLEWAARVIDIKPV